MGALECVSSDLGSYRFVWQAQAARQHNPTTYVSYVSERRHNIMLGASAYIGVAYDSICIANIVKIHQLPPSASPMMFLRRCDRPRHGKHIPICMYGMYGMYVWHGKHNNIKQGLAQCRTAALSQI